MSKKSKKSLSEPSPRSSKNNYLFIAGSLVALVYGIYNAYQLRWLCDDIFITFRYVQNWLAGNGVVYNVGERVEGYTHFLWMCLIALFQWLGSKPEDIVKVLGLLSYAATLVLYIFLSRKTSDRPLLFLPLTSLMLACNYDFCIWATSGLETALFTFLVSTSMWALIFWKTTQERSLIVGGFILVLALMTRPDGVMFFAVAGIFVLARANNATWKQLVRVSLLFGTAFLVIYLPYFIWKYAYYGDIFPNTYYAKSGGASYYSQGFIYLWVYFQSYISSFIFLFGFAAIALSLKARTSWKEAFQKIFQQPHLAALVLSLAYILAYGLLFVARVGGDFMYARFLHPIIPFMYFSGEIALQMILQKKERYLKIACIVLPLFVVYEKNRRDSLFIDDTGKRKPAFQLNGITDECWYWTQTESMSINPIAANELIGKELEYYFRGEHVSVLLRGQASLGYYAQFSKCIENAGLTDSYIAHLPLENRGRPGHEKNAPVEYLVQQRVNFVFFRTPYDTASYRRIFFRAGGDYARAEMFFYDTKLLQDLHAKFPQDVYFVDFQRYLDTYLATMKNKSKEEVEADYKRFKEFYFLNHNDELRDNAFRKYLGLQ